MFLGALLKTHLSCFTDYSFIIYIWVEDEGRKMQKRTTEKEKLAKKRTKEGSLTKIKKSSIRRHQSEKVM